MGDEHEDGNRLRFSKLMEGFIEFIRVPRLLLYSMLYAILSTYPGTPCEIIGSSRTWRTELADSGVSKQADYVEVNFETGK